MQTFQRKAYKYGGYKDEVRAVPTNSGNFEQEIVATYSIHFLYPANEDERHIAWI